MTKTFPLEEIKTIKINLYAQLIIDQSLKESITITTDENLFDFIQKEVKNGTLNIDQIKWIEPSTKTKILIGAPNLRKIESGTHDITKIINIDNDYLQILAPVGHIILIGKTKELRAASELAVINASDLIAQNARINIWGSGKVSVNVTDTLDSKLGDDARLIVLNQPKKLKGDSKKTISETMQNVKTVRYIHFKIKNNSQHRNDFFVEGPKPDGSYFGYGFPMMPQTKRKEYWTTGTKIYKVNKF